jgi:hypothetical protein
MVDRFARALIVAFPLVLACTGAVDATGDGTGGASAGPTGGGQNGGGSGAAFGGSGGTGANAATGGGGALGGAANDAPLDAVVVDASSDATFTPTDGGSTDALDAFADDGVVDTSTDDGMPAPSSDDVATDVACVEQPVWTETSSSFSFGRSSGGLLTIYVNYWEFSKTERTLLYGEGLFDGDDPPPEYLVHLSDTQFDAIVAQVGSIRTICRPDGPAEPLRWTLTVSTPGVDASDLVFEAGATHRGRYISYAAAVDFTGMLTDIINASCRSNADGGDGGDVGFCGYP